MTDRFDRGRLSQLMLKDVDGSAELAEELGVSGVWAVRRLAVASALGHQDITTTAGVFERRAGVATQAGRS